MDITHSFDRTTSRRIGGGLIALGLLLWLLLPFSIWKKHQFIDGAAGATAQVIDVDGAPKIQFRTREGASVDALLVGWRPGDIEKGDVIEIVYSQADPYDIEHKASLWTGQVAIAIMASLACLVGVGIRKGVIVIGPLKQSGFGIG